MGSRSSRNRPLGRSVDGLRIRYRQQWQSDEMEEDLKEELREASDGESDAKGAGPERPIQRRNRKHSAFVGGLSQDGSAATRAAAQIDDMG